MNSKQQIPLIHYLKKQIAGDFPYWVLFNNGTYIIIEDINVYKVEQLEKVAIKALQKSVNQQTTVQTQRHIFHIPEAAGWIINFSEGIYSFVKSTEFDGVNPSEIAVYLQGQNKKLKDLEELNIIHTNYPIH